MSIIRAPGPARASYPPRSDPRRLPGEEYAHAVAMLDLARKAANELADLVTDHAARRPMGEFP